MRAYCHFRFPPFCAAAARTPPQARDPGHNCALPRSAHTQRRLALQHVRLLPRRRRLLAPGPGRLDSAGAGFSAAPDAAVQTVAAAGDAAGTVGQPAGRLAAARLAAGRDAEQDPACSRRASRRRAAAAAPPARASRGGAARCGARGRLQLQAEPLPQALLHLLRGGGHLRRRLRLR